eukprot:10331607-Karenia_brevis.AAC.1
MALDSLKHRPTSAFKQDGKSGSFVYSGRPLDLHLWLWQLNVDLFNAKLLAKAEADVERTTSKSHISREPTAQLP